MRSRQLILGLTAAGLLASSCSSVARDAVVDAYNNEVSNDNFAEACRIDSVTLATATQAYEAQYGVSPTNMTNLVPEYLREAPDAWTLTSDENGKTSFAPSPGGRCDGVELNPTPDRSIGQTAADAVSDGKAVGCSTDKRAVETAIEIHFVEYGSEPETIDDLAEFGVIDDTNRWTLEAIDGGIPTVVPVPGGPCDE